MRPVSILLPEDGSSKRLGRKKVNITKRKI